MGHLRALVLGLLVIPALHHHLAAQPASLPDTPVAAEAGSRPHVDALRKALKLSPHLKLEWMTSTNGTDTLRVTDDFNRTEIGDDWALDNRYWAIVDGELVLTSAAIYEWRYLAVFRPVYNNHEHQIFAVSYRWGKKADSIGIGEGAHALMIDQPAAIGNGYWLWRRTNQRSVWLYAIKNGTWEYWPGESKEFHRAESHRPIPRAGDLITAYIRPEEEAVYFDYYVNDRWDATVYDPSREFAQNPDWYGGVFIHGQDLNNQVDDFSVMWFGRDNVPPAAVNDLHVRDSSTTTVTLAWTAPGDNFRDGRADHYEVRYDTTALTAESFSGATLAEGIPVPAESGDEQEMVISGLRPNTTYYFALRSFDEVGNASQLSNVVTVTTLRQVLPRKITVVSGEGQLLSVGRTSAALAIRVSDDDGTPVPATAVVFSILSGGGSLVGGLPPSGQSLNILTDSTGQAHAFLMASQNHGDTTVVQAVAADSLRAQFQVMTATPDTLLVVAGMQQTAISGSMLPEPVRVLLRDGAGAPVAHHPVDFRVHSGEGLLQAGVPVLQVLSDSTGHAQVSWTLGPRAGLQELEVEAKFRGRDLHHSPARISAVALAGAFDLGRSTLAASPRHEVPADSQSAVLITALLRDGFGNPVAARTVRLAVTGEHNFMDPPETISDSTGSATALLRSTRAEWKMITAVVLPESLALQPAVRVQFVAAAPALLQLVGGNNQSTLVNQVLPEPVQVRLRDRFDNPVPQREVNFVVVAGEGEVVDNSVVASDSNGVAAARWRLGPAPGVNRLEARAGEVPGSPVVFVANAIDTTTTGLAAQPAVTPREFALRQNVPNPFNPETLIPFELAQEAQVELSIYDLTGRMVKQLVQAPLPAGVHRVRWDGRTTGGYALETGIYFCRLRALPLTGGKPFVATRKLILAK